MERGFIRTEMELKSLILYLLGRVKSPVDMDTLTDLTLCDNAVSYFDFTQALSQLIDTDHVILREGRYSITGKGRKNGDVTMDSIPYSVRLKCDRNLAQVNARILREERIQSSVTANEFGGYTVHLSLEDDDGLLFTLGLRVNRQEDCGGLIARFRSDPEEFFRTLRDFSLD